MRYCNLVVELFLKLVKWLKENLIELTVLHSLGASNIISPLGPRTVGRKRKKGILGEKRKKKIIVSTMRSLNCNLLRVHYFSYLFVCRAWA